MPFKLKPKLCKECNRVYHAIGGKKSKKRTQCPFCKEWSKGQVRHKSKQRMNRLKKNAKINVRSIWSIV